MVTLTYAIKLRDIDGYLYESHDEAEFIEYLDKNYPDRALISIGGMLGSEFDDDQLEKQNESDWTHQTMNITITGYRGFSGYSHTFLLKRIK